MNFALKMLNFALQLLNFVDRDLERAIDDGELRRVFRAVLNTWKIPR